MRSSIVIYFTILLLAACIEPFEIKGIDYDEILVVDGFISNASKKYQISLSRTSPLNQRNFIPERDAQIWITDNAGSTITLTESAPGIYETPIFSGVIDEVYKLFITTRNGHEYASQEVTLKDGPPIGNISAKYLTNRPGKEDGIEIYIDTEDPSGKTRFYRWNYIETYQIQAPFPSNYIWEGGNSVTFRHHGIDTCWVTDTLKNVMIKSTAGFEQDKVVAFPLRLIPESSIIMRYKYSIFVQQFPLTEEAYLFWDNLRIINETQGSLSDVQPGSLAGNITSLTDDRETVLGYFTASAVSEKRVFFTALDFVADGFQIRNGFRSGCYALLPILAPENEIGAYMATYGDEMYIWDAVGFSPVALFELMPKICCDCTDLGTNNKPSFWE